MPNGYLGSNPYNSLYSSIRWQRRLRRPWGPQPRSSSLPPSPSLTSRAYTTQGSPHKTNASNKQNQPSQNTQPARGPLDSLDVDIGTQGPLRDCPRPNGANPPPLGAAVETAMSPEHMDTDQAHGQTESSQKDTSTGKAPLSFKEALVKIREEKHQKINMNEHAKVEIFKEDVEFYRDKSVPQIRFLEKVKKELTDTI